MISGRKILTVSASLMVIGSVTLGAAASSQAQTVAGVTPGALSVGQSGAASYSIPIAVPPGTGGMAPSLSLNYGSQGGNGLLGVGWSLGGLSVIHRCPANLAQDGSIDGVDYDANDKLCLDGQRLVAITGTYGADGTEYRTEIDGFAKVASYLTSGGGPTYFKVWTKSGQIMEYGGVQGSRIEAQGRADIRIWAVNRIEDTVGNYLTVAYFEDNVNGEYRPTRIDYTGNDAAALAPNNSVRFVYETRSDLIELYAAGGKVQTTQRLSNVTAYEGLNLVRDYRLSYDNGGEPNRSRVIGIAECDGTGACLAPMDFSWLASATGIVSHSSFDNFSPGQGFPDDTTYPMITGDWNGDGLTDMGRAGGGGWSFFLSTGSGWNYIAAANFFDWTPGQGFTNGSTFPVLTGDWNGDGMTDIARVGGNEVRFKVSTGNGWASYPNIENWSPGQSYTDGGTYPIFTGDWNGDGRTDVARVSGVNVGFMVSTGNGWAQYGTITDWSPGQGFTNADAFPILVGDWNGDGLTDVGRVGGNEIRFKLSTGTSWATHPNFENWSPGQGFNSGNIFPTLTGDWNGDGLTDIARVGGNEIRFQLSTGTDWAFFPNLNTFSPGQAYSNASTYPLLTGDWNGDGRTDVARVSGVNITFKISTQDGTWPNSAVLNNWSPGQSYTNSDTYPIHTGDWNGDGLADVSRVSGVNTGFVVSTSKPVLMTGVTDSLGAQSALTYKPMTDATVYTHEMGAIYPELDLQAPLYVVSQVIKDDGLGEQAVTSYTYGGAKAHLRGRGLLGFAWMAVTDQQSGIVTRTDYLQGFPYTGQVSASKTYMPDAGGEIPIKQLTNTWAVKSLNAGATQAPYVAASTAEAFEFNDGVQP